MTEHHPASAGQPGQPGDPAFLAAAALAGLGRDVTAEQITAAASLLLAAGVDTAPAATERLREYWTTGEGGLKIRWRTDGDFTRCVRQLREHMPAPGQAEGYCANLHFRMNGFWPGDRKNQ